MSLGTLTRYHKGYEAYGIKILHVEPEHYVFDKSINKYKYRCTWYRVEITYKRNPARYWCLYEYELINALDKEKRKCKLIKTFARELMIKLNAG